MVLIFGLRNRNSKYNDNDPDNNIKIKRAMDINQKFRSFFSDVFDEIYLQQLRMEGVIHVTVTNQIFK